MANEAGNSPMNGSSMHETLPTRRDFLLLAGAATAGASLIRPATLFAAADAAGRTRPKSILIPANAHPAIQVGGEDSGEEAGAGGERDCDV